MSKLKGLLLTEGMHGMISQVEGLANALEIQFTHQKVELKGFWKMIPPNLTPISKNIFNNFDIPDFDIIISCGRKSVIPSIHLKKNSKKKVYNIHIQDPKVNLDHFDFIVSPEHDGLIGDNVINTKGAIHYLTENGIDENKDYLKKFISKDDNRKILGFIIGGPTKHYEYSTKNLKFIFSALYNIVRENNFRLVVIPSMRTPKNTINYAKEFFGDDHTIIENIDKNAYLSALAISEYIVVTCDSSSMISEAALTGKPIYIANIIPKKNDKRFQKFRNLFRELNITRNLGEQLKIRNYQKLDETNRVAKIIKEKINF
ncbi:mitochondrial fission ELM1 family protein [Candidatus Pelagibacter sp.]|nr:mitochondrial fission ELM1 family protein [Candidatus Pelagibacter sp.]